MCVCVCPCICVCVCGCGYVSVCVPVWVCVRIHICYTCVRLCASVCAQGNPITASHNLRAGVLYSYPHMCFVGKKKDLDGVTLPAEDPGHPDVRKGKRRLPAVGQERLQYPQTARCSLRCGVLENDRGTHVRECEIHYLCDCKSLRESGGKCYEEKTGLQG